MARKPNDRPYHATFTYYELADGTRVKKGTPGARRVARETETYYGTVGGRRVALNTRSEKVAWKVWREKLQEHEDLKLGILHPVRDHALKPLGDHFLDWAESVRARGTEPGHVDLMVRRLKKLAAAAGWKRLGDVTADGCRVALAELAKDWTTKKGGAARGLSAQTRNHYLRHAKQFFLWAIENERWIKNPLAGLDPADVETDRRHDRRAPTDQEVGDLFRHLERDDAPARCGMTGRQRALGYRVAMATGFRAGELRSLTRASFDLGAGTVTVRASYSKRRREDVQHLPDWLAEELEKWFAGGGGCWERFPAHWPGEVLRDDLAAAGVPYVVGGLYFDFHALRHWYVTQVANQPGLSLKTLLSLTRHSTPHLAINVYAKARREDQAAAAALIPRVAASAEDTPRAAERPP
jgi:integrase